MDQAAFRRLVTGQMPGVGAGLARWFLRGASLPYFLAIRFRNLAYDIGWLKSARASIPVISVGNITVGGTGKTPMVEYLAQMLRRSKRVAILSRGYGAEHGANDEALVLEENLPDVPHLQGADRVELARIAFEELEPEVLLLDDGFQHRRLARDLDIVLVDALCPWGGGYLLPGGLLREPLSALARAHVIIITRTDQAAGQRVEQIKGVLARRAPRAAIFESRFEVTPSKEQDEPSSWAGKSVAAFCGVGNPESFQRSVISTGARLVDLKEFPDHFAYTRTDVEKLAEWASELPIDAVVTTQKDAVKLRIHELGGVPLEVLRIKTVFDSREEELEDLLSSVAPEPPTQRENEL